MAERLIELRNITKSFGRICALSGVSLSIDKGEVVGLVGDNGAGKSTVINILAGVVQPTLGEIVVRGELVSSWSATQRQAGIETVFQDRALAVQQSVVRNIFMGREIAGRFGWLKLGKEMREAERLMRAIGFTSKLLSPRSIVGQLSGGERQGVAIARAIYNDADLIILDEPTAALSLVETGKVFRFVVQVKASGRSIICSSDATSIMCMILPTASLFWTAGRWCLRPAAPSWAQLMRSSPLWRERLVRQPPRLRPTPTYGGTGDRTRRTRKRRDKRTRPHHQASDTALRRR